MEPAGWQSKEGGLVGDVIVAQDAGPRLAMVISKEGWEPILSYTWGAHWRVPGGSNEADLNTWWWTLTHGPLAHFEWGFLSSAGLLPGYRSKTTDTYHPRCHAGAVGRGFGLDLRDGIPRA